MCEIAGELSFEGRPLADDPDYPVLISGGVRYLPLTWDVLTVMGWTLDFDGGSITVNTQ